MPTAKRLPSGSWRCQAYAGKDESGKRIYKSFTAPTKKEAELMAAQYAIERETYSDEKNLLLKTAMERYNKAKENVLSPSTMRGYVQYAAKMDKRMEQNTFAKNSPEYIWVSDRCSSLF